MKSKILLISFMMFFSQFASANKVDSLVVSDIDGIYSSGTFPRGDKWLGLYCDKLDCEIRHANVRISTSTVLDVLNYKMKVEKIVVPDAPLILFYNLQIKTGPVVTFARPKEIDIFENSEQIKSSENEKIWSMPWGREKLTLMKEENKQYLSASYFIASEKNKQHLYDAALENHWGGSISPIIKWVGDLDGDDKIDFILSIPPEICDFDERLYLSSFANQDEVVNLKIRFSDTYPQCGC